MRKILFNNRVIEVYDSIEELPMVNFQKYNKYLLIDSGIGSDIDSIDEHVVKIAKLINTGDSVKAIQELQNMRQNLYMINSEISPRYLAFAALIYKIDGKRVYDISDDGLKSVLQSIKEIRHNKILAFLLEFKKKIQNEVESYFPADFVSVKEREAYDVLKRQMKLALSDICNDTDSSEEIEKMARAQFKKYKPKSFSGDSSAEIAQDKQFEDMCLLLSQKLNVNAKKMTVLEFYSAVNLMKKQAEAEQKALKTNKKK